MPGKVRAVFDWDDANTSHLARHGVTREEAEQVLRGALLPIETGQRSGEYRHTELGMTTEGRLLLVVWTWRRQRIRVVTAFPAKRKWRAFWERTHGGHDV